MNKSPPEPQITISRAPLNDMDQFTPKLVSSLAEGYSVARLKADASAGLTVAIVALPLSMAIAIASGTSPDRGLFTAIIGGFIISLLSGSRFQIGGPAGAFIVLIASIIDRRGMDGLLLSTFLAGGLLILAGYLRLGTWIRKIPHAVITGFLSGIAVLIFSSQIRDLFGLTLHGKEPAAFVAKLGALINVSSTLNLAALLVSGLGLAIIILQRMYLPRWPGLLIAVALCTLIAALFQLPVETIGSRFGGIPDHLPSPQLPAINTAFLWAALPDALFIALLGGIESLLSAVVADGMSSRQHRSNAELVAQGWGNMASVLFGGICVTGTIARTATNIRAGAQTPVAGIFHCVFLLAFMMLAAPLASKIPLAALAAVLTIVSWNMLERDRIAKIFQSSWPEQLILIVTFLLTVFYDLVEGIAAGCLLAIIFSLTLRHRSST